MSSLKESLALQGIPQTMLWTLHNRATEALRENGIIKDPDAVSIYQSIDFDYSKHFGRPDGSHALRSFIFDEALKPWLKRYPKGTVIELACGLETQFQRCGNESTNWICVDLPEAISVRKLFLPEEGNCHYVSCSALDTDWFDLTPCDQPVFISAQGLLMYFSENEVKTLLKRINQHYENVTLMFDTIPPYFSRKTMSGYWRTAHYKAPPMPWGISRCDIVSTLSDWVPSANRIDIIPYGFIHHPLAFTLSLLSRLPLLREMLPYIVKLEKGTDQKSKKKRIATSVFPIGNNYHLRYWVLRCILKMSLS